MLYIRTLNQLNYEKMKVNYSPLIDTASGKIGDVVASKGNGGPYFRKKVFPLNPRTIFQLAVRASLTTLSQAWEGLTSAEQTAWNLQAASKAVRTINGYEKKLVGFTLFVQVNQNITLAGGTMISTPVAQVPVTGLATLSATSVHSGATTLTFTATPVPANTAMIVRACFKKSGQKVMNNNFKYLLAAPAADASPLVITTEVVARLGLGIAGNILYVECTNLDITTGALSPMKGCTAIVS